MDDESDGCRHGLVEAHCSLCREPAVAPKKAEAKRVVNAAAAEGMKALLDAEKRRDLPPLLLLFCGHTPKGDQPGPWVLSQWWPIGFEIDGIGYHHAEGFMMAEKARLFGDDDMLARILAAKRPAEAKRLGRLVRGFDPAAWDAAGYEAVVRRNLAKFGQNPALSAYLRSTAPAVLVEASPRDRIWGIGHSPSNAMANRPSEWRGTNLLGFALTAVRAQL